MPRISLTRRYNSAKKLSKRYSKRPSPFSLNLLYFKGETTLTSDSAKLLPDIIATIRKRNSNDISVVGHTDTLGSKEFNTTLSHDRAKAVKALLVGQGVEENSIRTTSHGKENPLIPTGDNVYEPKNRRVEVVVK